MSQSQAKLGQLESEIVVLRGELSGSECDVAFWKERATAVDKEIVKVKENEVLRALAESVAAVIESDPHQWSSRPCQTCRVISGLLGRPFGCEKRAGKS